MEISLARDSRALTIALHGRLDTNTSPELESCLKREFESMPESLVLDLADAQYVSSAGLRVILFAQKETDREGASFVVRHPNEYVMEVFEATGFTDILSIER